MIRDLLIFIVILAVLKYAFGLPISIAGSIGLTLLITGVMALFRGVGRPRREPNPATPQAHQLR